MKPTLHFLCGKMAAGKSTLARKLAGEHRAVLISEDIWLQRLFPEEIREFADYLNYSARLKTVVAPLIIELLEKGISVVLDFPANVPKTRNWIRELFETANADHVLHFVNTGNDQCLEQLAIRNREKPEGSKEMTVEEFEFVTSFFVAPSLEENFTILEYGGQ